MLVVFSGGTYFQTLSIFPSVRIVSLWAHVHPWNISLEYECCCFGDWFDFVSICLLGRIWNGHFLSIDVCCRGVLYPLSLLLFGLSISCLCHILGVSVHQLLLNLCSGFYSDLSIALVPNQGGIHQILRMLFWFYHNDSQVLWLVPSAGTVD